MFSVTALYFPFYFNVKFCTTSLLEAVFYQTGCCLLTLFGGRVKLLNFRCCFFLFLKHPRVSLAVTVENTPTKHTLGSIKYHQALKRFRPCHKAHNQFVFSLNPKET